jgi:hypothetical protein
MPDFTIQTVRTCRSNMDFETTVPGSKKGATYTVRFGFMPQPHPVQNDWSCSCQGFRFHGKCKHIAEVKASKARCGWNGFLDNLEPAQDARGEYCCPECGGPVEVVQVAV